MMLPETPAHFQVLKSEESRIKGVDELKDVCSNRIWLQIIKSDDLKSISKFNNPSEKLADNVKDLFPSNWRIEQDGKEFQKCWLMEQRKNFTLDKDCFSVKSCAICKWVKEPTLRLKGLCEKSEIEDHYTIMSRFNYNGVVLGKNHPKIVCKNLYLKLLLSYSRFERFFKRIHCL